MAPRSFKTQHVFTCVFVTASTSPPSGPRRTTPSSQPTFAKRLPQSLWCSFNDNCNVNQKSGDWCSRLQQVAEETHAQMGLHG